MNIPNALTILRFILVPLFGVSLLKDEVLISIILFSVAGLTDVLDGYIARKYNMITTWGKIADPMADKLLQLTSLVILTYYQRLPWAVVQIVLIKEIIMIIGGIYLYRKNIVLSSGWYGKLATVFFYFAIVLLIFKGPMSDIIVYLAVFATIFALLMYSISFWKVLKKSEAIINH